MGKPIKKPSGASAPKADPLTRKLAQCFRDMRHAKGWSLDELTERSTVSRATLSRLEHAEVSPTAQVLSRVAAAYDLSVSQLLRQVEDTAPVYIARDDQPMTRPDPKSGVEFRMVSTPSNGKGGVHIVEITLPQDVPHALALDGGTAQIVLVDGRLNVTIGGGIHAMRKGDSLWATVDTTPVGTSVDIISGSKRGARFLLIQT